ncbi:MAG TPA: acetylglutamate kinase [Candidatus Scatomorpha intestinavium]|uniref:Acetylglutamate kinase n=1 Tax=Candidatus Scatomorpha intestinavium TaxID=2840922 RepID=A0A9D0ZF54_9FIRM|nr:acetylglutamate kinase [Candidatus Scatomorpha intestinavium]
MDSFIEKGKRAQVLVEALPYIQEYWDRVVVVKYGGHAMTDETLKRQVMEDIVLLQLVGVKVVLVHGGGPEINAALAKMGVESKFVNGLRVTDAESMDVVQMVLAGKVNKSLVNLIGSIGGKAMGICGIDGRMVEAKCKDPALGQVGAITGVNTRPIYDLLDNGYIPVISSVACDAAGNVYNVNADSMAAQISGALGAECLISMTDVPGIMEDPGDISTLINAVDIGGAMELMRRGVVKGGMIPKVESCMEALLCGVKKVFILDGRVPHSILLEMLTDEGSGTMMIEELG